MHNPESVLENDTHKILWDFDAQTDHLLSARRPVPVIVDKKEDLPNSELCRSIWPQRKTERKVKREIIT